MRRPRASWDFGEDQSLGSWPRFWRDLFGWTAREGLYDAAARLYALENDARAVAAITPAPVLAHMLVPSGDPEHMLAGVMEVQRQTTARLNEMSAEVQAARVECQATLTAAQSLRDEVAATLAVFEGRLAEMPARWSADLQQKLDALRQESDAAHALLLGTESFAASIARHVTDS